MPGLPSGGPTATQPKSLPRNTASTGMLANLKNTIFNSSKFVDRSTNINANYHSAGPTGLDSLRQHISLEASHDANIINKPECSPDTRLRILKELEDWMNDLDPDYRIIWLHGPAGAGKSAIAQTIMQRAEKKGCLGASFFFSRGAEGRGNADRLFSTISYQLARKFPDLAQPIDSIVRADPDLPLKSLDKQFDELITRALRDCHAELSCPIIGIDGVDECDSDLVQAKFLTIICNAAKSRLPLRFLISSRPEPRIKAVFQLFDFLIREIMLETSTESLKDVSTFLDAGFTEMRGRYSHFMHGIPQPWPLKDDLQVLQERSSGHFIYPATVLKFVGEDNYVNPVQQLDIILQRLPKMTPAQCASPYPELDRLYYHVLAQYPNPSQLCQILMFFIHLEPFPYLLDQLLDAPQGTALGSLSCMHSLIRVSESDSTERPSGFHHASFRDFLIDANQSLHFHIHEGKARKQVQAACTNLLIRWIKEATLERRREQNPHIAATFPYLSNWHCSTKYICKYLANATWVNIVRIRRAIPFKSTLPSKSIIFILHQANFRERDFISGGTYWSNFSRRLDMVYRAFLADESSSNLRFLLKPPYIFLQDLSLTLWKPVYGVDPSAFINEFYHLLVLFPDVIQLPFSFQRYVSKTNQFNLKNISQQDRDSLVILIRKIVQILIEKKDQQEYNKITIALGRSWTSCFFPENVDDLVLVLQDWKTRKLKSQDRDWAQERGWVFGMYSMLQAVRENSQDNLDLYKEGLTKISKELLYLSTDSPSLVKIYSCFLMDEPNFFLKTSKKVDNAIKHLILQSDSESLHLSTDFQLMWSSFRYSICWFLMDQERAGDLYVPMEVICQDLNVLPKDIYKLV